MCFSAIFLFLLLNTVVALLLRPNTCQYRFANLQLTKQLSERNKEGRLGLHPQKGLQLITEAIDGREGTTGVFIPDVRSFTAALQICKEFGQSIVECEFLLDTHRETGEKITYHKRALFPSACVRVILIHGEA